MNKALTTLCQLADAAKVDKHPTVPYLVRSKYSDKDANGLTRCVVDYLKLSGHFATRLASTGTYRADLQKFVPSQQRAGMPDVLAIIEGRALFIEIKTGKDRLSAIQQDTHKALSDAGAWVYVTHNFQDFVDWFAHVTRPPFA